MRLVGIALLSIAMQAPLLFGPETGGNGGNPPNPPANEPPAGAAGDGGQKVFTQADIDRAVAKGIATFKQNSERENEEARLKAEAKYKELYEKRDADAKALELKHETAAALEKEDLGFLASFYEGDLSSVDARVKNAKGVKKAMDAEIEKRVAERLRGTTPPTKTTKEGGGATGDKLTPEQVAKLTPAEYRDAKKAGKIPG